MRFQSPVGYKRRHFSTAVIRQIEDKIEKIARTHNVSKSYVIAVALADAFGITDQERYYNDKTNYKAKR